MKVLRIVIDSHESLLNYYIEKVNQHNQQVDGIYPNSGFDLICPELYESDKTFMVNFKVKGAMYDDNKPVAYYLFARSSISKTRFRLANSVGIIDSGYRGNLCAYFDVKGNELASTEHQQRLVQICAPSLEPFRIEIVESLDQTARGEGGFGSTGV